jgi:isoaspartyl peptidase/L-asparaginase-like protein (Ntn-hydrolase superfamily)
MRAALHSGGAVLAAGGSCLDAVEAAVVALEDDPAFNAGRGAVFTSAGTHELDAAIMDGRCGAAGAVAALCTVRHPVRLARLVMERTPHVLMVGEGAERLAAELGVERVDPVWFDTPERRAQLEDVLARRASSAVEGHDPDGARVQLVERGPAGAADRSGTVGAVARDRTGGLAAATSTGGMTGKLPGRVGDSPVIGAGTWADARCAVSGTGHGEVFLRTALAARVAFALETGEGTLAAAAAAAMARLRPGDGGFIAVSADGSVAMPFNSEGMFRGVTDASGRLRVGAWPGDEEEMA